MPLSADGEQQAVQAARALAAANVCVDCVFTSTLKRTIKSAWLMLEELDSFTLPIAQSWRLNERMYGALTGLNKAETRLALGDDAFERLRIHPPPISADSCYDPARLSRFESVPEAERPSVDAQACAFAAASGQLGVLQWLRRAGAPWDEQVRTPRYDRDTRTIGRDTTEMRARYA